MVLARPVTTTYVLATLKGQAKAIRVAAEFPIPMDGSLWTCPWGGTASGREPMLAT